MLNICVNQDETLRQWNRITNIFSKLGDIRTLYYIFEVIKLLIEHLWLLYIQEGLRVRENLDETRLLDKRPLHILYGGEASVEKYFINC